MLEVMKAFTDGATKFVRSFWDKAAGQSFALMILVVTNTGFAVWIHNVNQERRADKLEHKSEMATMRNEYRQDFMRMEARIDSCQRGASDCERRAARLEGENKILLSLINER